jgi:hypothetical protein
MNDRTVRSKKERGVALLIALFALMLLAAVAFEMMYVADVETVVNDNFRSSQRSYDAAWSGVQEARERLMPSNTAPHLILAPTALPGAAAGSIIYIRNPRTPEVAGSIDPTTAANAFFDNEICHENFVGLGLANPGIGIPCAAGPPAGQVSYITSDAPFTSTAGALDYKWVRITQKANNTANPGGGATYGLVSGNVATSNTIPICWDGVNEQPKPAGYVTCDDSPPPSPTYFKTVYILTSLAVTPTGARRMAQMEVALDPPFITNASLDTDDLVSTIGSSLTINGFDNCKCACPIAKGKSVPVCTDRVTKAACTGNTYSIFTSKTVSSSGAPALVAGTSPAVAQNQVYPYDVPALIDRFKNQAGAVNVTGAPYNLSCSGSPANCGRTSGSVYGTPPNPFPPLNVNNPPGLVKQVTYFPGSIDLQAHTTGAGIMIVDGDLTVHGGIDFYGLLIVRGVLTFAGGGSGQANNIIGGVVAGNGQQAGGGVVADALGGAISMQFDSCALANDSAIQPPLRIAFRELPY